MTLHLYRPDAFLSSQLKLSLTQNAMNMPAGTAGSLKDFCP
jgi:hypothetical protein